MSIKTLSVRKEWPIVKEEEVFGSSKIVSGFFQRDFAINMHKQEFYEINIVTKGSGEHFIGDYQYSVSVGDVFIVPPDVYHGYLGGEGFDVYHVVFSQQYMEKHASDLQLLPSFSLLFRVSPLMREKFSSKLQFTLTENQLNEILPILRSLESHSYSCEVSKYLHMANCETMLIIVMICDIYEKNYLSNGKTFCEDESILKSISYVYENYNENISIDELLKIACMSRTSYLNKFKQITGSTPKQLQIQYKIFMSKTLLVQTNKSISEIAEEVNFYDLSHFKRVFTRQVGISPNEYRKKRK